MRILRDLASGDRIARQSSHRKRALEGWLVEWFRRHGGNAAGGVRQNLARRHGMVTLRILGQAVTPVRQALRVDCARMRFAIATGRLLLLEFGERWVRIGEASRPSAPDYIARSRRRRVLAVRHVAWRDGSEACPAARTGRLRLPYRLPRTGRGAAHGGRLPHHPQQEGCGSSYRQDPSPLNPKQRGRQS